MADFLYCLNSSTIKPTPILDKIAIAAEAGYSAIELWHDDIDAFLAEGHTTADIRKAVEDQGLTVPTYIFLKQWCDTTGAEYTAGIEECKRRLALAAEVGAIHAIAGPPLAQVDRRLAAENYRKLLEIGQQAGVKPAMEYLGFADDINTIEDALSIMDNSGHADATIVHDPFHIFRGGGSVETVARIPADRVAICHFNDAPTIPPREQQHDPDRVMPGDGHLDLKRLLDLLRDVGYNRWLSLELFREDLWAADPREVARIGLEKMRAVAES